MDVAFATYSTWPAIQPDDEPLRDALLHRGIAVHAHTWDDPAVDWSAFDLCLIRSTWDYHHRRPAFLAWAERVAAATRLWNPVKVVRWNTDKRYLLDLERAGVPIVPTAWISRGSPADLACILPERGWDRAVIKPAVSASSEGTRLVTPSTIAAAQAHLARLLTTGDVMVQRFLESVRTERERSLVFVEGRLTHAVRRGDVFGWEEEPDSLVAPEPDEVELARDALRHSGHPILYARADLARDVDGTPRLMELELVEPSLMLRLAPWAAETMAEAVARRLR